MVEQPSPEPTIGLSDIFARMMADAMGVTIEEARLILKLK
jgi:hypothetical protein